MNGERLFELEPGYTLYRTTELTDEIVEFLENTTFGTQHNLYRHYYIREFIAHTPRTEFLYLIDPDGDLVGMTALCQRTFPGPPTFEGKYIRYYAASPKIRGKGITGPFSKSVMDWLRETHKDPIVFFGSIEGRNKASRAVANHLGFEFLAPLQTVGFSRFFPGMRGEVARVTDAEWTELLPRIEAQYAEHAFWTSDYLRIDNEYYVLKKDGRIVCGVQAHPAHWVVENLSGFMGKYVLPILPYVPIIRDIFNPKAFHFIAFEGVFAEPGYEAQLVDLFESVLYLKKRKTAMVWFDERDPLYIQLLQHNKLGLFNRFTGDAKTTFVADFTCYPNQEHIAQMREQICYGVAYDYV
jgi:RimJ/RimL family protein N-acetyltransferase